jgi:regulator of protease activity HflC (stomatin/prohibitin superfamily)
MILIIGGAIAFLYGILLAKQPYPQNRFARTVKIAGGLAATFGILSSIFVQIQPGEVGVMTLFGKVQNRILYSGLNVINPLVEVVRFDARTQNYTMSSTRDEASSSAGDDAIRVLSADGLEVIIDLTVLYRIDASKAPEILSNIGIDYRDKVIRPTARTAIRDNAVYYEAVALYSSKRDEFQNRIFAYIEKAFKERGFILEQLLVRNITLPESVKMAIESKINAEQEAQKMQFILAKERQEAERKRVEAQGIADYQRIINENLTEKQLQYESIKAQKEIATSANAKIIIIGKGNTPVILGTDR